MLSRRHRLTDFFFSLSPLEPRDRPQRIFSLARQFVVEVETHPVKPEEYSFLIAGEIFRWTGDIPIASRCPFPRPVPLWKSNTPSPCPPQTFAPLTIYFLNP